MGFASTTTLGCLPLCGALLGEGLCSRAKMDLNWAAASEQLLKGEDPLLPQKKKSSGEELVMDVKLKTKRRCWNKGKSLILLHGMKIAHPGALTLVRWPLTLLKQFSCVPV